MGRLDQLVGKWPCRYFNSLALRKKNIYFYRFYGDYFYMFFSNNPVKPWGVFLAISNYQRVS
jgi:hypothetical protein